MNNHGGFKLVYASKMLMIALLSFALLAFSSSLVLKNTPQQLPQWISIMHTRCLSHAPSSTFAPLYKAIVCGENLQDVQLAEIFRESGLIHILVVSGSHLILLSQWIPFPSFQIPILIIYSCVTGFQPPVVRALIQIFLQKIFFRYGIHISNINLIFISGLVTWSINPLWITSISFQLSWICALALAYTEGYSLLTRTTIIYFSTSLILAQFHWPHPIAILMNAAVAPIIGGLLFPLSLLTFFMHFLTYVVDPAWALVIFLCKTTTEGNLMFPSIQMENIYLWILIWFLHFSVHLKKIIAHRF